MNYLSLVARHSSLVFRPAVLVLLKIMLLLMLISIIFNIPRQSWPQRVFFIARGRNKNYGIGSIMRARRALNKAIVILFILLLMQGSGPVFAEKKVHIKGVNRIWGDTDGEKTFLEGKLVATQNKTIIYAPKAEMNKDSKIAIFSGGVKLIQEDTTISGDVLEINFHQDIGTFSGEVRLEREETKDDQGKVEKDRITLTCATLEINTETKDFTAKNDINMIHTDFTASSRYLEYLDAEEIMTFSGGSYLKREEEEVWGEEIRIELKKKVFEVKGEVEINFEVKENKEDPVQTQNPDQNQNEPQIQKDEKENN